MKYILLVLYILIILGLAAVLVYPYVLAALSQKKMLSKLRRIANRQTFNVIYLRRFPWLPKNFGGKYDIIVEGRGRAIAFKLMTPIRKNSSLVITPSGNASIVSKVSPPLDIKKGKEGSGEKELGKTGNISEINENWSPMWGENMEKGILIYPAFKELVFDDGRGRVDLSAGDTVFGKTIYTPYFLEQKMRISGKALSENNVSVFEKENENNT